MNWQVIRPKAPDGWFYSKNLGVYQKVKGRVVVYVTPLLWGYTQLQLYKRGGNPTFCELEAKHARHPNLMFQLGERWLDLYADGDLKKIHEDPFSIQNPEGVWIKDKHLEQWWIGGK